MNTKTFAQEARKILIQGVAKKLLYWGFNEKGETLEQPEKASGGYSFRNQVFDDPSVPDLWKSLQTSIENKGIDVIVEEAAYTWFNRIMALRILVKNGYEEPQLEDATGLEHTPVILQKARQGKIAFLTADKKKSLQKILTDYSKDQEAFAILIKGYCHNHKTLQRVFGKIDDYTELLLPDNMLQADGFLHLLNTTDAISDEEYQKVELIGWLYQFYISEKKDEVFASFKKGKKAEAKDIPAATQIFTPNWIVKYMVENTAGKIWLDKHPNSNLKNDMKYLVANQSEATATPIISSIEELTLIDPAAGSGHILVEGFDLIYKMYLEEYYTPEEAVESILKNNLYGLDIDDRAVQLATFAILLKSAKVYPAIWSKNWLPNVYEMPESEEFSTQEIKDFLGDKGTNYLEELETALCLMKQAKNLGSVMKLTLSEEARTFIEQRFITLKTAEFRDLTLEFIYQKIKNYIPVLLILTKKYTSVVANPPYMGQKSMNVDLKNYVNANYPLTKSDLMTIFMEVIPNLTQDDSRFALINLPSWLFLSSFEKIRKSYIDNFTFDSLLHMGRGIFGIDFGSVAFAIKKTKSENAIGSYFRLHERNFQHILYKDIEKLFLYSNGKENYKYDFNQYRGEEGITEIPENGTLEGKKLFYPNIPQTNFSKIPGSPIAYWISANFLNNFNENNFKNSFKPVSGIQTGDNNRFQRKWFEVSIICAFKKWFPVANGGDRRKWYGNHFDFILWDNDGFEIKNNFDESGRLKSRPQNENFYFKEGVTWNRIAANGVSARYLPKGFIFDQSGDSFFSINNGNILNALGQFNSVVTNKVLEIICPTLNVTAGSVKLFPLDERVFDINITRSVKGNIDISKQDWDSRETSWDFEQSPLLNKTTTLESAYATWEEAVSKSFFQLHKNEEELNRIFIDIYGLQDELTPEVALKDITILQEELAKKDLEKLEESFNNNGKEAVRLPINKAEVISQFISYAIGLFMGRYRLDKKGLNIAHPNPSEEELESYSYNNGEVIIDEDAIIPLMGTACNFPDDGLQQVYSLLDTLWGAETRTENINFIQECLNKDLEQFLVTDFYKYHCKMYKKKPIYWLFSSKKGAFKVLVYMHRMNAFTVEKIRDNYLLEHIKNVASEITFLENNEANLNTQDRKKLEQLRKNLQECYDYEAALKTVADNQITFDLDDGVTVNYKKFETIIAKIK
ncbi:BREX-1 system adenine-specific DNA-methyltransferase PglX [Tenacibaculum dicentrarchi]|nr:BREX-1 system adenine-specific DNA-methyltransferase PglX [Tenacibaculum dicentrarchi]MCD8421076.1 BREX-1 system adenine-specific DNA-methyltransferase PglX [Tenacibaculum dicentrarchi]